MPTAPNLSSYQTGWGDFFLAYYQEHPGCESPQSTFRQHALEIIEPGFASPHERYLEEQYLAYTLQVWSEKDDFLWESQMSNSSKYVASDWKYIRIEQAGHWFMLEQPDKTNQLLLSWFKRS